MRTTAIAIALLLSGCSFLPKIKMPGVGTVAAFKDAGTPATTSTKFRIGNDARTTGNALWDGRLERCWIAKNYIPSAGDCAWLYNGGIGRKYPFN